MWQIKTKSIVEQFKALMHDIVFIVCSFLIFCQIIHFVKYDWFIYLMGFFYLFLVLFLGNLYIPHKNVEWKNALLGAFISFSLILVFNVSIKLLWNYVDYSYTKTYGLFASLFLSLIWLEFTWLFFLIGVSSACAKQKHYKLYMADECKDISPLYKLYLTVLVASFFVQSKRKDDSVEVVKEAEYSERMKIPFTLSEDIIKTLTRFKMLRWDDKEKGWVVKDTKIKTVGDLIELILKKGSFDMYYNYTDIQNGAVWKMITNNFLLATRNLDSIALDEIDGLVDAVFVEDKRPYKDEDVMKNFVEFKRQMMPDSPIIDNEPKIEEDKETDSTQGFFGHFKKMMGKLVKK